MHYHTLILLLLAAILCQGLTQTNGTDSYFLSPQAMASTTEVDDGLNKIIGNLRIKKTIYNHSNIAYTMQNFTFTTAYNRDGQTYVMERYDNIKITGGRILFNYRFNYTRVDFDTQTSTTGYAEGSVLSDPLTYTKQASFCNGFICWKLRSGYPEDLTLIENRMKINKMVPFISQADHENMEDMLDKVFMAIHPANIQIQLLDVFNEIFPAALQSQFNKDRVLDQNINYSFLSSTHGEMKMDIYHNLYRFGGRPIKGYELVFVSEIIGWDKPICDSQTITEQPYSFEQYGDKQDFHLNCFYQAVVEYLQYKGWLDAVIDKKWETDGFKLNAGNLFEVANNLILTFSPEAQLEGQCTALKEGLRIWPSLDGTDIYNLDIKYECSASGISKEGLKSQMLKFQTSVRLSILAGVETSTLTFQIVDSQANHLKYEYVNNYFVTNIELAKEKVNAALRSLKNTFTFGTGFPTLIRKMPKAKLEANHILYYEGSTKEEKVLQQ